MKRKRLRAEWEPHGMIMVTLPGRHTDWDYVLGEALACYQGMLRAFSEANCRVLLLHPDDIDASPYTFHGCDSFCVPYNDTWIRDYGPLTVEEDGRDVLCDFGFNGWGLKFAADKDNLVIHRLLGGRENYRNELGFVLEGGSIESDGKGTILTTTRCLTSPNRNGGLSKEQVEKQLRERLGAERVLWLDHGGLAGDDTDGHIDTLARLLPEGRIAYVKCTDRQHPDYEELAKMEEELRQLRKADGEPYQLIPLPLPHVIRDEEGEILPATYANYLVFNCHVFVPTYSQPDRDAEALRIMADIWPAKKIVGVDCRALVRQHGSLHCATMQTPLLHL